MHRILYFVSFRPVLTLVAAALSFSSVVFAVAPPRVLDSNWQIELIAFEPRLVTPTGCCFDDKGRLLVIECHTHFPPDDYDGPNTDRIYLFDDSDGDGVLDRKRLFHAGGVASMNIANLGGGWVAVTTRSELVKIRDSDGDDVADQKVVLLEHKTKATYPHNGLGGLTFGLDGWLYVGQGENFGESYELIGTDGSMQIGGGEGGNVFRCKPNGSRVERVATGFWNPFGICLDTENRMWIVGNDPDSMPPNRLMQAVPTSDFGFQFRFGRAGIHPLQSWDGEFPGTMPMVTGTGEAACAIVTHGQHLWATSWGDNRIERYTLKQRGASFSSETEVVVQGDANFRPVGMSVASDDSIYITDWVDRSYEVHGKGRLWRLSRKSESPVDHTSLQLTDAEQKSAQLSSGSAVTANERLMTLQSDDPFLRQAAIAGLIQANQLASVDQLRLTSPQLRVGIMSAWRWKELSDPNSLSTDQRRTMLEQGLHDGSDDVVLTALRWATERRCMDQLPVIRALLDRDTLSPRVFSGVIASIAYLETGSASGRARDPAIEKLMVEFAKNPNRSASLRGLAVRRIPAEADSPSDSELGELLDDLRDRAFALEVIHLLAARTTATATDQLAAIAEDTAFDVQTRADALASLSQKTDQYAEVIDNIAKSEHPVLQTEVQRIQNPSPHLDGQSRPARDNIEAWNTFIGDGGNADAGRRVFFRKQCATCHRHSRRGENTGPDLTSLAGQMTRGRVLESILQPSKEVGPLYVPWIVQTVNGKTLTGLKLDASGVGNAARFQGGDGEIFEVPLTDIEVQEATDQSIMPVGLEETMTLVELRDLIAFLTNTGG